MLPSFHLQYIFLLFCLIFFGSFSQNQTKQEYSYEVSFTFLSYSCFALFSYFNCCLSNKLSLLFLKLLSVFALLDHRSSGRPRSVRAFAFFQIEQHKFCLNFSIFILLRFIHFTQFQTKLAFKSNIFKNFYSHIFRCLVQ